MNLGALKYILDGMTDDDFVFSHGFTKTHSWRGSYDEVAFEPQHNATLKECKHQVKRAFSETFYGWKGGEYQYNTSTRCNLDFEGCYNEDAPDHFEHIIVNMLLEYTSAKAN